MIQPGTVIPQISCARDILPTLCDLCGVSPKTEKPLDGISLKPLLLGQTEGWPRRLIVRHWKDKASLRTQQHLMATDGAVFDMIADPNQESPIDNGNLPPEAATMIAELQAHRLAFMNDDYFKDERPFVIAHPEFPYTQLPARDGEPHGNIERSNKFPNDSYFLGWTSTEDKITWSAQVGATGKYKVTLYYAAKEAGGQYHLTFGDNTLDFTLAEANDAPLLGADDDRSLRSESYTKDWLPVEIGEIQLTEGDGELVLHASELPAGGEGLEFRMFFLERVDG